MFIYTHGRGIWTADLKDNLVASVRAKNVLDINVYPNPATDHIKIAGQVQQVTIYNSNGQKILSTNDLRINTQNWIPGTYFLEATQGDARTVKKIIINR